MAPSVKNIVGAVGTQNLGNVATALSQTGQLIANFNIADDTSAGEGLKVEIEELKKRSTSLQASIKAYFERVSLRSEGKALSVASSESEHERLAQKLQAQSKVIVGRWHIGLLQAQLTAMG
jgi:hypothetical protein